MTEPEYWANVEAVAIKFADHPQLAAFRSGYTAMNRLMIKPIVAKLRAKVEGKRVEDPTLVALHIRKTKLYKERAKLSNRLLDAPNQRKGAMLSREIDGVQKCIEYVVVQIRRAEDGVSIQAEASAKTKPTTPLELDKRIRSLRSMRSRTKAALEALEALPNRRNNIKAITKKRKRLDEIARELKELE